MKDLEKQIKRKVEKIIKEKDVDPGVQLSAFFILYLLQQLKRQEIP